MTYIREAPFNEEDFPTLKLIKTITDLFQTTSRHKLSGPILSTLTYSLSMRSSSRKARCRAS